MGDKIIITLIYQTARENKRDIRMSYKSGYFVPVPYPFLASKHCGFSNSPRKFLTMPCGGPVNSSRSPEENKTKSQWRFFFHYCLVAFSFYEFNTTHKVHMVTYSPLRYLSCV